jgi:hypothetical protein
VADVQVGDHVAVRYIDHVEGGKPTSELPVIEGVILSLPAGDSPFYEVRVSDEEIRAAGGWVDEEAEGLPYLATEKELLAVMPRSMNRKDVEEWLANAQ